MSSLRKDSRNAFSISNMLMSQLCITARFRMIHRDLNLAVGANVESKSRPGICEYPFATSLTLYFQVPSAFLESLNKNLLPIANLLSDA